MDMKDFYEGLSPEQKERFKACEDGASVVAFAKEEKLALPEEFLDRIAGGASFIGGSVSNEVYYGGNFPCPKCGSTRISEINRVTLYCMACGNVF